MLRHLPLRLAALLLGLSLAGGAALVGPSTASASPTVATAAAVQTDAVPPSDSLRTKQRYLDYYGAKRVSWSSVIKHGAAFPTLTASCAREWANSGKDTRVNWSGASYLCLDALKSRGSFLPQGVGGSSSTRNYMIGSKSARDRNIIVTTWYSKKKEPGLFAPNRAHQSVTRLAVMDMDKKRYRYVELVRPDGATTFRNLNSHGSGVTWTGQYLYVSSKSVLLVFNADDLLLINGHYVLPAVARWTLHGLGGMSSISIDRTTEPDQLKAINYTKKGQTYVQDFALRDSGLLAARTTPTTLDLTLKNAWGEDHRVVHPIRSTAIPGYSYQGVAGLGSYCFASSSAITTEQSRGRKVDAVAVFKTGTLLTRFQMPRNNVESVYIDGRRDRYNSVTEGGRQFLFSLPVRRLIAAASN